MLLIVLACSSSSDDQKSKGGSTGQLPGVSDAASVKGGGDDQFAGVSGAALLEKWQGTWLMPFHLSAATDKSAIGTYEIWTVNQATLTRFNGTSTRTKRIDIVAPCLARFLWKKQTVVGKPVSRTITSYTPFYFAKGALHAAHEGGYQQRGVTFACFRFKEVVVHRGDTCHLWTYPVVRMGPPKMERHPATCSYTTVAGKRYFEVRSTKLTGGHKRLLVSGDLLIHPTHDSRPARKFPSHAAALQSVTNR